MSDCLLVFRPVPTSGPFVPTFYPADRRFLEGIVRESGHDVAIVLNAPFANRVCTPKQQVVVVWFAYAGTLNL